MKTNALNAIQALRQPPIGLGGNASRQGLMPETFFQALDKIEIQPTKIGRTAADPHTAGLENPTIRESAKRLAKTIFNSLVGKK